MLPRGAPFAMIDGGTVLLSRWFMEAATVTWLVKLIEIQGADVILSHSGNPARKTAYDLIADRKKLYEKE